MDHTRRDLLRSILALGASAGLLPVVACGDDGSAADGGPRDSGSPPRDGGSPPRDGGSPPRDGGSSGTDGGSSGTDGGSSGTDGGSSGSCEDTDATIAANHGHVLMVPVADVMGGAD